MEDATHGEAEGDGPDVDEYDRAKLRTRHARSDLGRRGLAKRPDDPHADRHDGSASDNHGFATEPVGEQ
jgi:hypothetical protein